MKNEISYKNDLTKKLIVINEKDPILQLYNIFLDEINTVYILEYLYYNIKRINNVLYNKDRIVTIKPLKCNDNKQLFQYYFYLDLLCNKNIDVKTFVFSIDIIRYINDQKIDDSKKLKKIIISKIVMDLINSYKSFHENYDDIKSINIDKSIKFLNNSCDIFNQMNIEIKNINLEVLYMKIIISLFENKKFEDYEYVYDIIEQLNLEYINLTKNMLEQLLGILNSEKDYIKEYIIITCSDFLEVNKINFYYILWKYLLKNSFYIYQIPFLLETKKIIQILIRKYKYLFTDKNNKYFKEKYILKAISDSPYYISKNKLENENQLSNENCLNINHSHERDITYKSTDDSNNLISNFIFKNDAINFIKELANGYIIISGNYNVRIYNYAYTELKSFKFEEPIYNLFVNKNINNENNEFSFIINFENNKIFKYDFSINNKNEQKLVEKSEENIRMNIHYFILKDMNTTILKIYSVAKKV